MAKEKMSPMFANMTQSDIPKTPREKKMWIAARRIVAKQSGLYEKTKSDSKQTTKQQEQKMPWGLVTTIYKNAKKANKIPKQADWKDAKVNKTVKAYVKPDESHTQKARRNKMNELRDKYKRAA